MTAKANAASVIIGLGEAVSEAAAAGGACGMIEE